MDPLWCELRLGVVMGEGEWKLVYYALFAFAGIGMLLLKRGYRPPIHKTYRDRDGKLFTEYDPGKRSMRTLDSKSWYRIPILLALVLGGFAAPFYCANKNYQKRKQELSSQYGRHPKTATGRQSKLPIQIQYTKERALEDQKKIQKIDMHGSNNLKRDSQLLKSKDTKN